MMNGVSLSSMIGGGWGGGAIPNATGVSEMVFDTASVNADLPTGGVRINFIAREGGNQYHGSLFGNFANGSDADHQCRAPSSWRGTRSSSTAARWTRTGTSTPASADHSDGTRSGSIAVAAIRAQTSLRRGMFYNANENNPARWDYVADPSRPASAREDVARRAAPLHVPAGARNTKSA